jgi:anti-sigma regulatory factor (Ser/Thr protein kinase)
MNSHDESGVMEIQTDGQHGSWQLPNTLDALPPFVDELEMFGGQSGWTNAQLMQVNLVLEELIVNAIDNGYPDGREGQITIQIDSNAKAITIGISDDGDAFDPFSVASPDLSQAIEDRPIGGLGIHLVRSYMDTFEYEYVGQRNQITLTKNLA